MLCSTDVQIDWDSVIYDAIQDESVNPELSILNKLSPELILQVLSNLQWNEALSTAPVCSLFRELLQSASLWARLKELNFTECSVPLARNILKIISMCPATEKISLAEVIIEEDDFEEDTIPNGEKSPTQLQSHDEQVDNPDVDTDNEEEIMEKTLLTPYDKFIAKVLKHSPRLKDMTLESHQISGKTVEAICQAQAMLDAIHLSSAEKLENQDVQKLLSHAEGLKRLQITQCQLYYPQIKQANETHLSLTSLSLIRCGLRKMDIAVMGQNCSQLKSLDLSESSLFDVFGPPEVYFRKSLPSADGGWKVTPSNFPKLESLELKYCRDMEQLILVDLMEMRRVETNMSGFLSYVKLRCPNLLHLDVDGCTNLTEMVVHSEYFKSLNLFPLFPVLSEMDIKCPRLDSLALHNCPVLRRDQIANIECLEKIKRAALRSLQVSLDDVVKEILPKLQDIEELSLQAFASGSLLLTSKTLQSLHLEELLYLYDLRLETPRLRSLNAIDLRILLEADLVTSLPESLRELHLIRMPGLHGGELSQNGGVLSNLSILEIRDCKFMKMLNLSDWPSLSSVTVGGCSHLKEILVRCRNVKVLQFWWLHISKFTVETPKLEELDLKGSDFENFHLTSQSLKQLEVSGLCTGSDVVQCNVDIKCPVLKRLWIQKSPFLTSTMMEKILCNCQSVTDIHIMNCQEIRKLTISSNITALKLVGLYHLTDVALESGCKIHTIWLSGLPKITLDTRNQLLEKVAQPLENLQVRLMNDETFVIKYPNVTFLSIDQGLHLDSLEIQCPRLKVLRVKGCPNLTKLLLEVDSVSDLDISQSMPLNSLRHLHVITSSSKLLAKILSQYCPRLLSLELKVTSISLADIVRFGLRHRNLENVVLHSGAKWDQELSTFFPRTFRVPYHVMERQVEQDLCVSFK